MNPFLGVMFHWLGGLASGSFYVPYKGVKKWSWETYWLVGGFFSWIIVPWILASTMTSNLLGVLGQQSATTLWWTYFFGAMWGLGGLTFGLTMRYLGMSLGMGVALGYCAAFGTLVPPIFTGEFGEIVSSGPGLVTLGGVLVCLMGIGVTAMAGLTKEREMPEEEKKKTIKEFSFTKGILVATFSGIMSACFAFGLTAGQPIGHSSLRSAYIQAAKADGKTILDASPVNEEQAGKLVDALKAAQFFKDAEESVQKKPSFTAVIDQIEAPIFLQSKLQAAKKKGDNQEIKKLEEKLDKATKGWPAQAAALLVQAQNPMAARLIKYQADLTQLMGKADELSAVEDGKHFTVKEVAVATALAGGNLPAYYAKFKLWTGLPILVVVLLGGFTTNFIWCVILNIRNRTGYQYFSSRIKPEHAGLTASGGEHSGPSSGGAAVATVAAKDLKAPMLNNYFFSALAGTTWYMQFFFYTMGETQMGRFGFASWTLHMASIIIFSTMWGWILHEWKGASKKAHTLIAFGIGVLIISTVVIGLGTYLKGQAGGH